MIEPAEACRPDPPCARCETCPQGGLRVAERPIGRAAPFRRREACELSSVPHRATASTWPTSRPFASLRDTLRGSRHTTAPTGAESSEDARGPKLAETGDMA